MERLVFFLQFVSNIQKYWMALGIGGKVAVVLTAGAVIAVRYALCGEIKWGISICFCGFAAGRCAIHNDIYEAE